MSASPVQFALGYANRGLHVVPLRWAIKDGSGWQCSCNLDCTSPAKHPMTANGLLDATKDRRQITTWWERWPEANVGIRTGAVSGIIVLDVDPRHDGDDTLHDLEREHGELPPTWKFHTGGGGEHYLFRHLGHEIRNSAGQLGLGLDIRGDGGYIVAPPSLHISGRRYVVDVDGHPQQVALAPLPDWIDENLRRAANSTGGGCQNWLIEVSRTVCEGERNDAVARLSGLLARGLGWIPDAPRVVHELVQSWNSCHCRPPLLPDEVTRTVRSIWQKEARRRSNG